MFEKTNSNKFDFQNLNIIIRMKKYKMYKKVEPVCFDFEELLSYIILPLVIASYISYPVLYFLGFKAAVLFNTILAFIATFHYKGLQKFLLLLKKSSEVPSEFVPILFRILFFMVVLVVLSIANYGFYLLVLYQKTNQFDVYHFYIWILIFFGLPLLYYSYRLSHYFYHKNFQSAEFLNVILDITYDLEHFISIDNIQFVNTTNNVSSDIKITDKIEYYSQKEFLRRKTKTRKYYKNLDNFRELTQIPLNTNLLLLSWFSHNEKDYYQIEIPFPFDKLNIKEDKCSLNGTRFFRNKKTNPLYVNFYSNGSVKLFNNDVLLIDFPNSRQISIIEN